MQMKKYNNWLKKLKTFFFWDPGPSEGPEDDTDPDFVFTLVIGLIAIFLCWFIVPPLVVHFSIGNNSSLESWAQLGDSFGSVNALFSGISVVGVAYALFLQVNTIRLQRREIILTREQMKSDKIKEQEQSWDFNKRLDAIKDNQHLTAFNLIYANISETLSSITLRKKIAKNNIETNQYVSDDIVRGMKAIKIYFSHLKDSSNPDYKKSALANLTTYEFDEAPLSQYLHLYEIAQDLVEQIQGELLKQVCREMLDRIHQPNVTYLLSQETQLASIIDQKLVISLRKNQAP